MEKTWLLDGRTLAESVKLGGLSSAHFQEMDHLNWECSNCSFRTENHNWPGLPAGVKFDPSDEELLNHLAAKRGLRHENQNQFIDVFIPTIDVDEGICYTHPENLPGARKDGNSFHLYHRPKNAHTSGTRVRRQIYNETSSKNNLYRWRQTGKVTPITSNEAPLVSGYRKIFVLYEKRCKLDWVRHEIHLGRVEDKTEGAFVVSKIFNRSSDLETPMYEDISRAPVLQMPCEAESGDNVNLIDAAESVDSDAIFNSSVGQDSAKSIVHANYAVEEYTTIQTSDLAGLDIQNDGSFSELLYMLENADF